ncbi:MAG: SIMPL domain-containing protein [Allosphingosinicella sp.]|uniref:SIMPL domain-containing protein n=1 Tax=Allosphingosinicella sp. TaxID=2823234 RepID=UPI003927B7C2
MLRHLILASAAALALSAAPSAAQQVAAAGSESVRGTRLDVVATGEVRRAPDIVFINAGVTTQAPTATAAIQENARQMEQIRQALRRAGVADRDIQTSSINLHPEWRHTRDGAAPEFGGYRANNQVRVRFRDVARAGRILDTLVQAGANNVDGPMLAIERPEPALDEARIAAIRIARERADLYARSLGMRVRRIVSVSEGGHFAPQPMMREMAITVTGGDAGTQIMPGEQTLAVTLTVSFELE